MPTVEWRGYSDGSAGVAPWDEPWRIFGNKTPPRRRKASVVEEPSANVDSVTQTYLINRVVQATEPAGALVPLGDADKASIGIEPSGMYYSPTPVLESVFFTYPDDPSWDGVSITANQWNESPTPNSGTVWVTGFSIGIVAPGPMSRNVREITFSTLGFYPSGLSDATIIGFEWDFNGDIESILTTRYTGVIDDYYRGSYFTREFPNYETPGGSIRLRGITSDSAKTAWCTVHYNPCANAAIQQLDNETISVDGTESFDPDGTVTEWIWRIGTNFTIGPTTFNYTAPTKTIPISSIPGPWGNGLNVVAELRVRDNEGLLSLPVTVSFVYRTIPPPMGMIDDAAGQIFTAVNLAENVAVSKFTGGMATRELIYTIPNAKNPSYAYNARNNTHYVSYESREDGTQQVARSIDGGATWL